MSVLAPAGSLDDIVESLISEMAAGRTRGGQLCVLRDGRVVADVAVGDALPSVKMRVETLHNLYCGVKPVTATAVLAELFAAGVDVESCALSELVPGWSAEGTLVDLLSHRMGLAKPGALDYFLSDPAELEAGLKVELLSARSRRGGVAYSEIAAWVLVARACESVLGRSLDQIVRSHVAAVAGDVWLQVPSSDVDRIGCYVDMSLPVPVPLLHDRIERFTAPADPGVITGYASAGSLARWYDAVLQCHHGSPVAGFPPSALVQAMTSPQRPGGDDPVLGRRCSFGLGFMTGLPDHGFGGRPSPTAFGHSGFMGNSFGLADPAHGLACAFFTNGLVPDRRFSAEVTRPWLVDSIYAAFAGADR